MIIYAKAALDRAQLTDRINRGTSGIELQLLPQNYERGKFIGEKDVIRDFASFFEVVHLPINSCDIADLPDSLNTVGKTVEALYTDKKMVLVFHLMDSAYRTDFVRKNIEDSISKLFLAFPKLEIAIENTLPFDHSDSVFRNAFHFENCEFVKNMGWIFGERIGTVLDVCHAKISQQYMEHISKLYPSTNPEEYELEKFFYKNAKVCKVIHLSGIEGNGLGEGHGKPLKSVEEAEEFASLYRKYSLKATVTLEVYERDYRKALNYSQSKDFLEKVL